MRKDNKVYTEDDLKEGMKLLCTHSNYSWFTEGKEYDIHVKRTGYIYVIDNDSDEVFADELIEDLNHTFKCVHFDLVDHKPISITVTSSEFGWWTVGEDYPIYYVPKQNYYCICDNHGEPRKARTVNGLLHMLEHEIAIGVTVNYGRLDKYPTAIDPEDLEDDYKEVPEVDVVQGCIEQLDDRLAVVNSQREQLIAERDKLDAKITELNKEKGDLSNTKTLLIKFENNKNK